MAAEVVSRGLRCSLQHVLLFCSADLSTEEFLRFRRALLGELGFGGSTEAQLGIMFVLLLADLVKEKVSLMPVLKAKEKSGLKAKENLCIFQN